MTLKGSLQKGALIFHQSFWGGNDSLAYRGILIPTIFTSGKLE